MERLPFSIPAFSLAPICPSGHPLVLGPGSAENRGKDSPGTFPPRAPSCRLCPWPPYAERPALATGPTSRRAPRPGRAGRGAGRRASRAGGVGCHPCAHLGLGGGGGAGSEPLRRRDLRGPRVEQEVSQGREPEGPAFPLLRVRRAPAAAQPARPASGDASRR